MHSIRHRLHLPPTDLLHNRYCVCHMDTNTRAKQTFDQQPAHLYVCDKMKGYLKQRHDTIRNVLCKLLNDMGCFVSIEPPLQYTNTTTHQPMRADLCVVTSLGTYYVDISVVCPSGNDYVINYGSDHTPLKSCTVAANDKIMKYTGKLPNNINDRFFIPIVWETYGGINKIGDDFIKQLCNQYSDMPQYTYDHIMNISSATLQMCNGMIGDQGLIIQQINNQTLLNTQRAYHQGHTMYLMQQYVSNVISIDWNSSKRARVVPGTMSEIRNSSNGAREVSSGVV